MSDIRSIQLKAMKGNDLKVLVSIALLGAVNIGNKTIKRFCGLSYPTIASCLDNLSGMDFVTQTHRTEGWQLTQGGRQMLLPTEPSTKLFDSEAIINIDSTLTTRKELESFNNSDKNIDSEILRSLHVMGIYNPTAEDMACLEHMSSEYIDSWATAIESELVGKTGKDIPLVIHLMQQNVPAPKPIETKFKICNDCFVYPCECINE